MKQARLVPPLSKDIITLMAPALAEVPLILKAIEALHQECQEIERLVRELREQRR